MNTQNGNILIVDDNRSASAAIRLLLKRQFGEVYTRTKPDRLEEEIASLAVDLVLLDMNFSAGLNTGNEGLYWLKRIMASNSLCQVVMLTAFGDSQLAVKCMKNGAYDFIEKPWKNDKLMATCKAAVAFNQSQKRVHVLEEAQRNLQSQMRPDVPEFIGQSEAVEELFDILHKVAPTDANVLILGENGTGKELVARHLHAHSKRKEHLFFEVDMGAVSESLFESEMFGHEKGAFTDAKEAKAGKFEAAHGGTLFLDEIGNLSLAMQRKLLTALQQRKATRLGGSQSYAFDVRLVCATNQDLIQAVGQNQFREDLLYRINTIQLVMPPLRERREDIALLAHHFLSKFSQRYRKSSLTIEPSAIRAMENYPWPGNVRELRHSIERAVILASGEQLQTADILGNNSVHKQQADFKGRLSLEEGERILISSALKRNNWRISDTARELKIGRQTLYRKIEKYHL